MVKKKSRIPSSGFRERVYQTFTTPYFSIKVKKNTTAGNRIGVVAGIAVHKNATKRNFWKRQVKSQLLLLNPMGKDIIVTCFAKINTLTKSAFIIEFNRALRQLL
jgi:ribonuclease P protein component